jgi:hypothetical protein
MKKAKAYSIILVSLCFLAACVPASSKETACIPPLADFAYYTGQGTPYPDEPVAPPEPWVSEVAIELQDPMLLGVRVLPNKQKEFWIWDAGLWSPDRNSRQQQLFIVRTDGTGLKPVLLDNALAEFAFPIEKLFIAQDNSVWIVYQTSERSQVPILGKYDEETGKILPIAKLGEIKHYFDYQTIVLLDERTDVFWFLVPYGYIYSYDPASDKLVQHISIADMNPAGAVMTPDGKIHIYIFRQGSPANEEHDALYLYSPQTETVEYVVIGLEVDSYMKNLFIDHAGRLWAGSFGWRDPDGNWYQTVRSPLFVLAAVEAGGERIYHWVPPDIRFETLNDVYWFTGEGGTYSLDFKTGEWCWVSTSPNLEKDTDGNLWMLVDKDLYRLSESP